ncbi:ExbD/TolR family protein [Aquimarina sp. M1]
MNNYIFMVNFKKLFVIVGFVLLSTTLMAQPTDQIQLPTGGEKINLKHTTPLLSFYVTKNQEVYLENKKLDFYEEIYYALEKKKHTELEELTPFIRILLYADKEVKYKTIDRIKSEIGAVFRTIYYQTGNIKDISEATPAILSGSLKEKNTTPIISLEDQEKITSIKTSSLPLPPPPPPMFWHYELDPLLYSKRKKEIQLTLKQYTYTSLWINQNGNLIHKGKTISIKDSSILKGVLKENQIVFLRFDNDITYNYYMQTIQELRQISKSLEKSKEKRAWVTEISYDLENLYRKIEITLK